MRKAESIPPACLAEVEAVYAELDAELSALGYACKGCGECCDLVRNKYRLYLSTLELGLVLNRTGLDRLPPEVRPSVYLPRRE